METYVASITVAVLLICFFSNYSNAQGTAISIAEAHPDRAVDVHNEKRKAAGASDMKMLTWDSDLAVKSQAYAEKCNFAHDDNAGSVGENIYLATGSIPQVYVSATNRWNDEIDFYDYNLNICQEGKVCGHYTQVVWANSEKIGCGAARCPSVTGANEFSNAVLVVCRYSPPGNFIGQKPYETGTPCSDCPSGWICNDLLCQDPTTTSTAEQTASTTASATQSTTTSTDGQGTVSTTTSTDGVPSTQPTQSTSTSTSTGGGTMSTTPTSASTDGSTMSSTSTHDITSTQATQNTPTSTSSNGSTTMSTTQETSTTTKTPTPDGCTAQYLEMINDWKEALNDWQVAFDKWSKGNCPTS